MFFKIKQKPRFRCGVLEISERKLALSIIRSTEANIIYDRYKTTGALEEFEKLRLKILLNEYLDDASLKQLNYIDKNRKIKLFPFY
ncbi:hypothetical protein [Terribacillus saccharophilus]|uniref:hypothetical protein n=1 Tax=Terribacillus saccharophilus TaxID=361277 RepID=UPI002989A482|nr:hypothetical protein [Terribacillus saccharophilus]MCM3227545.1 hypothetical protein [Terribacillus saccharophilus]